MSYCQHLVSILRPSLTFHISSPWESLNRIQPNLAKMCPMRSYTRGVTLLQIRHETLEIYITCRCAWGDIVLFWSSKGEIFEISKRGMGYHYVTVLIVSLVNFYCILTQWDSCAIALRYFQFDIFFNSLCQFDPPPLFLK